VVTYDIALINESSVVPDIELQGWIPSLQTQITDHFAGVWGTDAQLSFVPSQAAPSPDAWQLVVLDDSDEAGALGYHDVTANGLPLGKVFARSELASGGQVSMVCSHELLEMLADPNIDTTVLLSDDTGRIAAFPIEVCDMCEADTYGYEIDGVAVSDFAYPRWFDGRQNPMGIDPGALDYTGHLSTALSLADPSAAILPGGYLGMWTPNTGWSQLNGSERAADYDALPRRGSRRERRTRRGQWLHSRSAEEIASRRT
jgi:hypothetical protein